MSPFRPKDMDEVRENAERAARRKSQRLERRAASPAVAEPERRVTPRQKPSRGAERPRVARPPLPARCFCGCGARPAHWHHAIRESVIERHGGNPDDHRVLLAAGHLCHFNAHWSAFRRYRLDQLPNRVFEFAADLMGPGARAELRRQYDGDDPRMEMLP